MAVRFPAEWEPQSMVQLTFPHADSDWAPMLKEVTNCFVAIVEAITRRQKCLIVCDDKERVQSFLHHIPKEKLLLIEVPSNDTWARDHGGITVEKDGKPIVLDFVFNGWGLKFAADKDNLITKALFEKGVFRTAAHQFGGLALEGGALESDGEGTLLTTSECLLSFNRNPHLSKSELEGQLQSLLGVDRFLWLDYGYLAGDDTDSHIDTLARFIDVDTIMYVQCLDASDEHYEALRQMELQLQSFRQRNGQPYTLIALPMVSALYDDEGQRLPATYANFLIINGMVLLPIYGTSEDDIAIEIFENAFPKHEIAPIRCEALVWQHGSLHCVTMQYPKIIE